MTRKLKPAQTKRKPKKKKAQKPKTVAAPQSSPSVGATMGRPKTRQKTGNGNNLEAIPSHDRLHQVVTECCADFKDQRKSQLIGYLIFGMDFRTAAEKAGYSKSYANGPLYRAVKHNKSFRKIIDDITGKAAERFRQVSQLRLPAIAEIERQALEEYMANPKLAIDKPQLMKHMKQAAGVLSGEVPEQSFNFVHVQMAVGQRYAQLPGPPRREDLIDCEYKELDDE
jgi:hypothetical protein